MIQSAIASFSIQIVSSPFSMFFAQIIAFIIPSGALIAFSDWYTRGKVVERESSVRELEALFALEDHRPPRQLSGPAPRP